MTKKVILDIDTGIDDALAILYLLKHPNVEVKGLTTGFGNVDVDQATLNTLQIAELAGASQVPVYAGAAKPLLREWTGPVVHVHGENGIGNVSLPLPKEKAREERASDFIVRAANEEPGEISLIFVGRLTNLAEALAKDPALPQKVKEVVIMGGAVTVPGNVTPVSEANIAGDPEAASFVFEAGFPLTMVGLDVTMQTQMTAEDVEWMVSQKDDTNEALIDAIAEMLRFRIAAYKKMHGINGSPLHDPLAVAVALHPDIVKTEPMNVVIETKGELSSGATIADLRGRDTVIPNANVCVDVDADRFMGGFLQIITGKKREVI
ncbi:nucleoside hydrolase [Neobacillus notoginsengisoli]|uniref:Nucleoside hydrolase n=1 Tax=Neobacillus notoginsengisoli TaxID=1578198 RepID=A0A417YSP6_9BACI|nr:nucleoside hydrolase [Neobacillus notoginsengisoli]RHW38980.1 nucleoside hydrolase [Neobacillus notoginsengisoli]